MPTTLEGSLSAAGLRFAIVASRFNGLIVEPLIAGALDAIVRTGGRADDVTIIRCPGAWELPQVVRQVALRGGVDAVIALGAVIRGATPHFDYVAGEAASGLQLAALDTGVPVAFGLLTTETVEQAQARADKGAEAARCALEMADLFAQLRVAAAAT
jgi:6,7-dimethyl-8-ribityllumazine synthase